MTTKTKMHLSPSDVHQQLMKQTKPEMRYDGGEAWPLILKEMG